MFSIKERWFLYRKHFRLKHERQRAMIADNKPLSVTCKILALSAMELHDQLALAAAAVAEHFGLEDQDVGDAGGGDSVGHGGCWFATLRSQ
jgi:hypothetical protein